MAVPKLNKNAMLLVGALALGLVAAFLSISYVQQRVAAETAAARGDVVEVPVVVTKRPFEVGEVITEEDLSVRDVPLEFLPADAVTPDTYGEILNRMVRAPIKEGAPLSSGALVPLYDQFSRVIGPGKVGYTMSVDENNSLSGMIAPGDAVDILMTYDSESEPDASTTGAQQPKQGERVVPLLENVTVLATGRRVGEVVGGEDNEAYSSITLELTPRQAEELTVGRKTGEVHVMLRNLEDSTPFGLTGLTEKALMESFGGSDSTDVEYIFGNK